MLYDPGSFYGIIKCELWKEAYQKGYGGLTIEQIMARDPELGKRLDAASTIPGKLGPRSSDPNASQPKFSPNYVDSTKYLHRNDEPANMKQAIPGGKGSGIQSPPRYLSKDSLKNKWIRDGRIKRMSQ
jgi:hypothetical protein